MTTDEKRPLNGSASGPREMRVSSGGGTGGPREWESVSGREIEPSRPADSRGGAENACRSAPAPRNDPDAADRGEGDGGFASVTVSQDASSWGLDRVSNDAAHIESVPKSISDDEEDNMSFPLMPAHRRVDVVFEDLEVSSKSFFSKVCSKCRCGTGSAFEQKTLLHGVSGQFRAGELVAVMGPSGAGKTTLLNTISGFTKGMVSNGSVRLQYPDGHVTKKRNVACYLTQEDHVQPLFTAREIVQHAADLKVGSRLSKKARGLLVDDVMETLGLAQCAKTRASQLSGGQRKRLALAAELVDNPAVVFLDEPTTGLDMSTAIQCTQLMRRIARSGRAVICTIHQPSEKMLNMFDQLYLLGNGRCVFRGKPSDIIPFLNTLGFQCPKYHNPADFLLEVANNEYGIADKAMAEAVAQRSSEYPPPLPDIKEIEMNGKAKDPHNNSTRIEALISANDYQPSEWERFRVLVTRNLLLQHRDWIGTQTKIFAAVFVFLLVGLMFGNLGDDASRVFSNCSLLFIVIIYMCYTPEAPAVMKYPDEVQVVKREWFNNWYQLYTYSLALLISQLPLHVMTSTISCSMTYYMTGQLAEPVRFAHVTLAVILTSIGSESLGLVFGSLFLKKKIISLFIASTHLAYMILFSGFLALKPEMPAWFDWIARINHMHYALNIIIVAVYKGRGRISCPEDVIYCHYRESDSVLNIFGLGSAQLWENFLGLVIFIIFLRITGYLTLKYNVRRVSL